MSPGFAIAIAFVVAVSINFVERVSATFSRSLAIESKVSEVFFVDDSVSKIKKNSVDSRQISLEASRMLQILYLICLAGLVGCEE